MYKKKIMFNDIVYNYFENSSNVGSVDNATHTTLIGNNQGGAVVKLTARVKDNIIEDIKFKVYGGVALIASLSLITDFVKNKSVEEALSITSYELSEKLGLDSNNYVSSILAVDSLQKLFWSHE